MIKKFILTFQALIVGITIFTPAVVAAESSCYKTFIGIKPWYQYLDVSPDGNGGCKIDYPEKMGETVLKVAVAMVDILLRVAGIVAFVSIVYSGFRFVTAQGDPGKEKAARSAAMNAVIGLIIAVLATSVVGFVTRSLL